MDELTKRVARLVARYVEHVWPQLERSGGTPDEPMQTAKGSSNPPFSDHAHRVMDENVVAAHYIDDALFGTEACAVKSTNGIYFSEILSDLRDNPGLLHAWYDRDPARLRAFRECCMHVARGVVYVFHRTAKDRAEMERRMDLDPDYEAQNPDGTRNYKDPKDGSRAFTVRVGKRDLQARQRTREAQKRATARVDREIVEAIWDLEHYRSMGREEAKRHLARDGSNDWPYSRIDRAITSENKRANGDAA